MQFARFQKDVNNMRHSPVLLALAALCFTAALAPAQAADVVYIPSDKVEPAKTTPATLASGEDHRVSMSRRTETGQSEVHANETDVIYVLEGSATFVTGGTVLGGKVTAPGQIRGSGIREGKTHHLSPGDIIVIPSGTPHWFSEVPHHVVYYVVKAITP
jgi:quercetin dioxygenase-like cupin family protein